PRRWNCTCKTCGNLFSVLARDARKRIRQQGYPPTYCSAECRNNRPRPAQVPFTCEYCGERFTVYASEVKKTRNGGSRVRYCSRSCYKGVQESKKTTSSCEQCGKQFRIGASVKRHAESQGWVPGRFCSSTCYEAFRACVREIKSREY